MAGHNFDARRVPFSASYLCLTAPLAVMALAAFAPDLSAQSRTFRPITVQQKIALVVGNASYTRSPLVNPLHDARAVAAELRSLGFTVLTGDNLSLRELSRAIDDFAGRVRAGDLALFYFSGHGMQVDHENYLLPVDFEAATDADVPYTAYPASRVRDKLEGSGARLRILILDACRDNPYKSSRGGPAGLAPMGTNAEGTLIAFATGDNNVASDGPGQSNGLFTEHLLNALREPGLELHDLFKRVKEDVYYGSNKRQNPFTYDDIAGSFYFRPIADGGASVRPPTSAPDVDAWEAIRGSNDASLFEAFLEEYPTSPYAGTARLKLAALRSPPPAPARNPDTPEAPKPESRPEPRNPPSEGSSGGAIKVSKKEADAYNAVLNAAGPQAQIEAADRFVTSFADSKLKSVVLFVAGNAAESKGDVPKAIVYAQSAIDADPKNFQAMILVAGELARGTRENDLDKEEKLARSEKLAKDAITTVATAAKPNPQLTDDQWAQYKKDFAAQAHEDLGMIAAVRKKYDDSIVEYKMALDTPTPSASNFVRMATVYDQAGKPDDALAVLAKVLVMPNLDPAVKRYAEREQAIAQKLKTAK